MSFSKRAGLIACGITWLVAAWWFFSSPRVESLLGYLTAASGLLLLDVFTRGKTASGERARHDVELLAQLRRELPFRPVIEFLRDNYLASPFEGKAVWPLDDFCLRWTDAAHEFHDSGLERRRRHLVMVGRKLTQMIGNMTWDIGGGLQSVMGAVDGGEDRSVCEERGRQLDAAADVVVKAHQDLERTARQWESRRPLHEVVAPIVAVIVLAFPSVGLWRAERIQSAGLSDSLTVLRRERQELTGLVGALRDTLNQARSQSTIGSGAMATIEAARIAFWSRMTDGSRADSIRYAVERYGLSARLSVRAPTQASGVVLGGEVVLWKGGKVVGAGQFEMPPEDAALARAELKLLKVTSEFSVTDTSVLTGWVATSKDGRAKNFEADTVIVWLRGRSAGGGEWTTFAKLRGVGLGWTRM